MKSGYVGWVLVFSGVVLFAFAERPLAGGQSNASGKGAYRSRVRRVPRI